ncbi:protein phosphatase 1 regulatory subunit 15B-like [Heterodontus francisci]|uniref:protein phosphatase 1 regulatory subunit 15B-like n=1 Tax=Heterodontus francisci TaxID=7792 RepID=UPI00355C5784
MPVLMALNFSQMGVSSCCEFTAVGDNVSLPFCVLTVSVALAEMVQKKSLSHQPHGQGSKVMVSVGSKETNFHLNRNPLDPLSWSRTEDPLHSQILTRNNWWMGEGDKMATQSDQSTVLSTCTNPLILSMISPAMDSTGWSLEQEDAQALADQLSDPEEDDAVSIDWSITSEDDSSDGKQENDESDLWDSFFEHDPYNPMNFSASTGHMNKIDKEEKDDSSSQFETENDKLWDSFFQSTDPFNPLNFSACTDTCASTDKGIKNGVQSTEVLEATADSPGLRHKTYLCEDEDYSPPMVKQEACKTEQKTIKKVRFSPVVTVHPMIVWDFAYRAARKCLWEQHARDRSRFQRRIAETEAVIGSCLEQRHRRAVWMKIYDEAFQQNGQSCDI